MQTTWSKQWVEEVRELENTWYKRNLELMNNHRRELEQKWVENFDLIVEYYLSIFQLFLTLI